MVWPCESCFTDSGCSPGSRSAPTISEAEGSRLGAPRRINAPAPTTIPTPMAATTSTEGSEENATLCTTSNTTVAQPERRQRSVSHGDPNTTAAVTPAIRPELGNAGSARKRSSAERTPASTSTLLLASSRPIPKVTVDAVTTVAASQARSRLRRVMARNTAIAITEATSAVSVTPRMPRSHRLGSRSRLRVRSASAPPRVSRAKNARSRPTATTTRPVSRRSTSPGERSLSVGVSCRETPSRSTAVVLGVGVDVTGVQARDPTGSGP